MPMSIKKRQAKDLKNLFLCPECQTLFNPTKANIIEQKNDLSLIQIECQKCKSSILSLVIANEFFISNLEMVTDLTKEDFSLLKKRKKITADQVINFSKTLAVKDRNQN